ncbi:hypothetical protein ACM0P6_02955 [Komagataeibacter sucrofermentans]|nr:hypothetical protein [Komagataeibacter sucrofermentans]
MQPQIKIGLRSQCGDYLFQHALAEFQSGKAEVYYFFWCSVHEFFLL